VLEPADTTLNVVVSAVELSAEADGAGVTGTLLIAGQDNGQGQPGTIRPGYLKCPVGSHLVFYRPDPEASILVVVRILHQRMDIGSQL
jgi:plasmid stabilization system protein ParE